MKRLFTSLIILAAIVSVHAQYSDDFNGSLDTSRISGSPDRAAFSFSNSNGHWNITSATGHGEWVYFVWEFSDTLDFSDPQLKPVITITGRATEAMVLTAELTDVNGKVTDALVESTHPGFKFEFTAESGTVNTSFSYDFTGQFDDIHGNPANGQAQGAVDSTQIVGVRFRINAGFGSQAYIGQKQTYDKAFGGSGGAELSIDQIAIGEVVEGVNDKTALESSSVFPNPITDFGTISYHLRSFADVEITISNMLGEQLSSVTYKKGTGEHTHKMDVTNLEEGVYFVAFYANGRPFKLEKVYVNNQ